MLGLKKEAFRDPVVLSVYISLPVPSHSFMFDFDCMQVRMYSTCTLTRYSSQVLVCMPCWSRDTGLEFCAKLPRRDTYDCCFVYSEKKTLNGTGWWDYRRTVRRIWYWSISLSTSSWPWWRCWKKIKGKPDNMDNPNLVAASARSSIVLLAGWQCEDGRTWRLIRLEDVVWYPSSVSYI
jgi:hypothetical protein